MRWLAVATLALALALALAGCGGSARQLRLSIKPTTDMNDARSCYVLARVVDDKAYATESYEDVVAKAMAPDSSVVSVIAVVPGVAQAIAVPVPDKKRIALYALFLRPEGGAWRVLLPADARDPTEIQIGRAWMCWVDPKAPWTDPGVCGRWKAK